MLPGLRFRHLHRVRRLIKMCHWIIFSLSVLVLASLSNQIPLPSIEWREPGKQIWTRWPPIYCMSSIIAGEQSPDKNVLNNDIWINVTHEE
jgi:hypothetical protein